MNEMQRQAYLDAMGVDCYFPRLQLPSAKPSKLCVMPDVVQSVAIAAARIVDASEVGAQTTITEKRSPVASSARAEAMRALFDEPEKPAVKASVSPQQPVSNTESNKAQIPRFSLSIVRGSNILIIDDALPGNVNPEAYLQLLQNMLFALGDGRPQLTIDSFVWPMVTNSQVDQSETAARQTLESFLSKQVDQLNTRYILVMGKNASTYVCLDELTTGQFCKHPQLDAQLIATLSAIPMLSDPSTKRDVWRDLQPLHRVLKKH